MRPVLIIFILFLSFACPALAQVSQQIRRLPPSLERELKLKHGGKIRIVGFVDTLKAQNIIAQSIRDSASEELDSLTVKDSAIIMIDSSVSLTDKEWLDSMLAQLPEYKMTPEGIRFYYPADILIETNRKVVPPDTTLASKMDPVTKEDLPLYSELPMPKPFQKIELSRTALELGAGFPYLPRVGVRSLVLSNEKSALEINGKFKSTTAVEPAIKQYWQIAANGSFAFPDATMPVSEQTPQLDVGASTGVNTRVIEGERTSLSLTNVKAGFIIGSLEKLRLESHVFYSRLNESLQYRSEEELTGATLSLSSKKILSIALPVNFVIRLEYITNHMGLLESKIIFKFPKEGLFELKIGSLYVNSTQSNDLHISPIIEIRKHLSNALEIGASFEPENTLITTHELTKQNLFFTGFAQNRITSEPIHINLFANYFLRHDNELHFQARYINRNNEPVFILKRDTITNTSFAVNFLNTRHLEFEVGGSTNPFDKDKFIASLLFRSVSDRDSNRSLPYIPTVHLQASYQFGYWKKFIPQIEVVHLERPDHTFTFLNLDAKYIFSPGFQLKFRAENIFGSAGDFWTGYNEYPRAVWLSGQYNF